MYLPSKIEHIGYLLSPCVFPFPMARILLWSSLLSLVLCSYNRDYVGLVSEWIPIWQGPHTNALSKPGSVSFVIFVMIALNVFVFAFYLYDFQCGTHTHICQASITEWQASKQWREKMPLVSFVSNPIFQCHVCPSNMRPDEGKDKNALIAFTLLTMSTWHPPSFESASLVRSAQHTNSTVFCLGCVSEKSFILIFKEEWWLISAATKKMILML